MSELYYNLALRNSDVGNKESEKLYYCVLKTEEWWTINICQLSEPDFRGSRGLVLSNDFKIRRSRYQLSARRAKCGYSAFGYF